MKDIQYQDLGNLNEQIEIFKANVANIKNLDLKNMHEALGIIEVKLGESLRQLDKNIEKS